MDVNDYMNQHRERMLDELLELLRIPSISADPSYAGDTLKCALKWWLITCGKRVQTTWKWCRPRGTLWCTERS